MEEVEETIDGPVKIHAKQCSERVAALQYRIGKNLVTAVSHPLLRVNCHRKAKAPMECTVNWLAAAGMTFVAETGSGHTLVMDGASDGGGRNLAPRPMETVLSGTAACTAYDVVLILQRGRQAVTGCQVQVSAERADTDPKVFTKIHMNFIVSGPRLAASVVERAIRLSHEKYCSASIMLSKTADITTSFEIRTEPQT